jgi:YbbR domain-containing protein
MRFLTIPMRFLTTNFGWKLFSLLLSVGLWFAFIAESEIATSITVPVEFKNLPKDLEISSDVPDRLNLKVRGPSARMRSAELLQSSVMLDLASIARPGEQTFTLDQSTVDLPTGVILSRAVPSQIKLKFEKRVSRGIPVQVRFAGPPPHGYRVVSQDISPAQVQITGPQSRVDQLASVQTDPVDLADTVSNGEFRVSTFIPDPQVRFESSPIVTVRVMLEKIPVRQN